MAGDRNETDATLVRRLMRTARQAALGTLAVDGAPEVSHVAVATLGDGAPLLLLSALARHSGNLARDPRASLLIVDPGLPGGDGADGTTPAGDEAARARVTLTGCVAPIDKAAARLRFLRRHPDAARYVDFADFRFLRLCVDGAHLVAGFGRIVDVEPANLLAPAPLAAAIAALEEEACAHLDADHGEAIALMAERLGGARRGLGRWQAAGVDPHGLDLRCGASLVRVEFPAPVGDAASLRSALKALARHARATPADGADGGGAGRGA